MSNYTTFLLRRLSDPLWVERLVGIATITSLVNLFREQSAVATYADKEGGPIKSLPNHFFARVVTPTHFISLFITPVVYFASLLIYGADRPSWLSGFSLPVQYTQGLTPTQTAVIRIVCTVVSIFIWRGMNVIARHLGSQFHYIGLREKPKIVSSGPYGWVRHPLYSGFLAQELCQIPMYWSWAPLITFSITMVALLIKIPIEEKVIEDDKVVGREYHSYKRKVPYALVPGIW